ncbi:MAG: cation diffusion facilitator family transporter [Clostridia bacterium]|nr:cation diffusion facilitator family transporter [Clostridia bacterium]
MNEIRLKRGKIVSAVGIALNFVLAALKIVFGALFGLISVIADGVNNLSDCGSGVVSLVSFRIAAKPADKEHPYGHGRAEYIASMIIGFFVLMLGVELIRESIMKIISGEVSESSIGIFVLLGVSVAVKAGMFVLYRVSARRLKSDALRAASLDSACDCLATIAVIVGLVISRYTSFAAEGYAGALVALFILWEGFQIVRDASSKLLGQAPDPALLESIRGVVLSEQSILGMHDLRVYRFGTEKYFASAHLEMDAKVPALEAHEVIDGVERKVLAELGVEFTAHLDPVDLSDEEAKELEERIRAATEGMTEGLNLHDFRLVRGSKKKIIFEAGVPFACPEKDKEIQNNLERAVRLLGDYEPVVTVERE